MNTIWLFLSILIPYLSSIWIYSIPFSRPLLALILERLVYFIATIVLWYVAFFAVERFVRRHYQSWTIASITSFIFIVVMLLLALVFLQVSKLHFELPFFYLTLALLGFMSAAVFFNKKRLPLYELLAIFAADAITAYASFMYAAYQNNWQVLIFCIGVAGQVMSFRAARYLVGLPYRLLHFTPFIGSNEELLRKKQIASISRIYLLSLMSAVVAISVMTLLGVLHPIYFSIYAVLPLIARLAEEFRNNIANPKSITDFIPRNTRILLFIFSIISSVGLLLW